MHLERTVPALVYNQKAAEAKADYAAWKENGGQSERPALNRQVADLVHREGLDFLGSVPAQIKRNAADKWFEAMQAALKGLRRAPRVKPKHRKRNCYVTTELFDVAPLGKDQCIIPFKRSARKADRGYYFTGFVMPFPADKAAKSLFLSRKGRRFWLSMAHDDGNEQPTQREITDTLQHLPTAELASLVRGFDVGVKQLVTASSSAVYHPTDKDVEQLAALEKKRVKHQRRYSRIARANDRTAGTNKRKRTNGEQCQRLKLAAVASKVANIKFNRSHHISKDIADEAPAVAAFESINLQNLTRAPKAKVCEDTGRYIPNGARAKAGLNQSILAMNIGQMRDMVKYKLADRGKLYVEVKAAYSSQECSQCGHTEKGKRPTMQSRTPEPIL